MTPPKCKDDYFGYYHQSFCKQERDGNKTGNDIIKLKYTEILLSCILVQNSACLIHLEAIKSEIYLELPKLTAH